MEKFFTYGGVAFFAALANFVAFVVPIWRRHAWTGSQWFSLSAAILCLIVGLFMFRREKKHATARQTYKREHLLRVGVEVTSMPQDKWVESMLERIRADEQRDRKRAESE